jgi:hypothetical protein
MFLVRSFFLSVCLSARSFFLFVCRLVLSVCLFVCRFVLSVCLFVCSFCLFVCLVRSFFLSVCLSVRSFSVSLSICHTSSPFNDFNFIKIRVKKKIFISYSLVPSVCQFVDLFFSFCLSTFHNIFLIVVS